MANNLSSNTSTLVMKAFARRLEANFVLTKAVNQTIVDGKITPESGSTVYVKRPMQAKAIRTSGGDISASTFNDIAVGRAAATVQNYVTVPFEFSNLEEATQLAQMEELIDPWAAEVATEVELSLGQFMIENSGLTYGTPGTVVDAWTDVAGAQALGDSIGWGSGDKFYVMNSFTQVNLANVQSALKLDPAVKSAWEDARVTSPLAGLTALKSNALKQYTAGAATPDRTGTLAATPNATWATHKDTMVQTLSLTGLQASTTNAVRAGDVLEFTGTGANARSFINAKTRQTVLGIDGNPVKWRCTVVTGGNTDGAGAVTVTVTNPAIYGASGGADQQFQTISAPLTSGDVFTILGSADTVYQPNLCFHRDAFAIATVKPPKLYNCETMYGTSPSGLTFRITKYSNGDTNKNRLRADLIPVFGVLNPLMSMKAFGV